MAYTEKVSLSSTALSFLLYECVNSINSQEGFLIGDITSEITNHISDSQSDNARLDTQIVIKTVLPMPSVSLFYFPTGRIRENILSDILSTTANEVVGWYKYRKNTNIKPTFRDKLISKGLQKYFEKHHGKKTFITCNLSNKVSLSGSTHTVMYRFGKINCFDMYEYIEDVTANLGEKVTGYKKIPRLSPHCIFNKIVKECNLQGKNSNDAILHIQEAVDLRLKHEAKIAAKNECTIRELEAEIKQMHAILSDKHFEDLQTAYNKTIEDKFVNREIEMADACVEAINKSSDVDILSLPNIMACNHNSESDNSVNLISKDTERCPSPILTPSKRQPLLNYAAALKSGNCNKPSTSTANSFSEDLIRFDVEDKNVQKPINVNKDTKCFGDSSPEY